MSAALAIGACERCHSALERGDLRCAVCGCAAPDLRDHASAAPEGPRAKILRCQGCHAAVQYDAAVGAPRCPFCGALTKLEELIDPPEQIELMVPFETTPHSAQASLKRWLSKRGFWAPGDLATAASVESLRPLWWVGWQFDARALVSWTADSDADHGRSDWAPHAGQVSLDFRKVVVPASRGLHPEECRLLTRAYDESFAAPEAKGPPGAVIEHFDVQRSAARAHVTEAVHALAIEGVKRGHIPGRHFRNVHAAVALEGLTTRRIAFPAYVLAYRYRKKLYRFIVHGQRSDVVTGVAPRSLAKVLLVSFAVFAAFAAVITGIVMAKM